MKPTLRCALALLCALSLSACSAETPGFAGRFADGKLDLQLQAGDQGFTGSIRLAGQEYQASAQEKDAELRGSFSSGGEKFPFVARWVGEELQLSSGGTTYKLKRSKPSNPLARKAVNPLAQQGAAATPALATTAAASPAGGKLFRHSTGLSFRHPDNWQASEVGNGVVSLVPADRYMVNGQAAEAFLVFGDDADGVTDIGDPKVAQQVRGMIGQMFPHLQAQGDPSVQAQGGRKVLSMAFAGSTQGVAMRARLRLFLAGPRALGSLSVGEASRFAARDKQMAAVFASITLPQNTQPKATAAKGPVGSWQHTKTYISGSFSSVTVRNLVLRADGTCLEGGRMMAGMEHSDSSGNPKGWSQGDTGKGVDKRGRWETKGKQIVLRWQGGGSETWGYYLEGDSMLWQSGGTRKLWKRR